MGWRGTLRSMQAAVRAAERDARRRQRELERRQKELEKMQELERARYEVAVYENYIDVLLSVHKDCGQTWDWKAMRDVKPPVQPLRSRTHESAARADLESYKPGVGAK